MKKILNHNMDVIKSLTLGELAEAYQIKIETRAELMLLFEFILSDYENDCYNLLYRELENNDE